jgi:hypothetical protein
MSARAPRLLVTHDYDRCRRSRVKDLMDILLGLLDLLGLLLIGFLFWLLTDWDPWQSRAKSAPALRRQEAPELAPTLAEQNA